MAHTATRHPASVLTGQQRRGVSARAHTAARGFTLIEMLVVVGIVAIVSGLVLVNNNRFGGVAILQNLAYDMALSVRKAQIYGISVARFGTVFAPAYGMHFQSSSPTGYVLFADVLTPRNGVYDCPAPGTGNCELMQATSIITGYKINTLCATPSGGSETCGLSTLDITFQRPEPDAYIRATELPGLNESARIVLQSPQGITKSVTVEVNGQISVE